MSELQEGDKVRLKDKYLYRGKDYPGHTSEMQGVTGTILTTFPNGVAHVTWEGRESAWGVDMDALELVSAPPTLEELEATIESITSSATRRDTT